MITLCFFVGIYGERGGTGGGGGTCVYVGLAGYAKLETVISAARCVGLKLIV